MSCSQREEAVVIYSDVDMNFSFDYLNSKDSRSLLQCNSYTQEQKEQLNREFIQSLASVQGKRNKTVAAATFLVSLDYAIPYGFEWIISDDPSYELVGRYTRKGLFLDTINDEKGVSHKPWGCMIKTHYRYPRQTVQNLGDYYQNGLNCSSFIGWCLYNAEAVTDVELLERTYANEYRTSFPGIKQIDLKEGLDLIRPGDLIGFPGHIAIIIGVKGDKVIYASAEGGHTHPNKGVSWLTFDKKTTNFDTFAYKTLVQMSHVYGD